MRHWPKMGLVYLHYLYSNFYFFLNVFHSGSYFQPFSCQCSFPIPPENIRKSDIFCCFQGLEKETSEMKWVNELFNCFFGYIPGRILVGNKTKGWISKRVLQENKARQVFQKNEHFLPLDTRYLNIELKPCVLQHRPSPEYDANCTVISFLTQHNSFCPRFMNIHAQKKSKILIKRFSFHRTRSTKENIQKTVKTTRIAVFPLWSENSTLFFEVDFPGF